MSADGRIQTVAGFGASYMYVSTNYGNTWTAKDSARDWRVVAMSADGKIQTAVVYNGQIYISSDYGNTWTAKDSTRNWYGVAMSSDGKIMTSVVNGGNVYVSYADSSMPGGNVQVAAGQLYVSKATATYGSTTTINWNSGNVQIVTLTGTVTFAAPSNLKDGAIYTLMVKQDGTGSRTATWNAVFKWPGGTAPVLTTTANAVDIFTFVSDGTNLYNLGYASDVK